MRTLLILSDLHLELSDWEPPAAFPRHDIAVFAGDMHRPLRASLEWLASVRDSGPLNGSEIVLVPGNHEFYGAQIEDELGLGADTARGLGIHLLDRGEAWFGDLRVLGCTLWTDYALYGTPRRSMAAAEGGINDHRAIRNGPRAFSAADALERHGRDLAWLSGRLRAPHDGATVVVTHHGPSPRSVHPKYGLSDLNPAFSSDLDALILETGPDLWVHGHTHASLDYALGRTRVVCNPKGYGPNDRMPCHENAYGFDEALTVDVG